MTEAVILGVIQTLAESNALNFAPPGPWDPENPNRLLRDNQIKGKDIPGPGQVLLTEQGVIYHSSDQPPVVVFLAEDATDLFA